MSHHVAALMLDGADLFEISIAHGIFGLDRPELGPDPLYTLELCARGRRARISGGGSLATVGDLASLADADTVIVPFGHVDRDAEPDVVDAIATAHARGARIVSFCSGSFTVAQTGLLDGRHATTHWLYTEAFRRRFPRVTIEPNVLFVDEGDVLTSAGSAAGIDLALHLVRLDHGAGAAASIARRMVVAPHREGGQAQFIEPDHWPRVGSDIGPVLDWALTQLHRDIGIGELASRAAMSRRTFARRFKEATGTTPLRWLQAQRLHRAQQLLETSDLDMEQVASRAGFGSATTLRHHFRRTFRTTPTRYRQAFRLEHVEHVQHVPGAEQVRHAEQVRRPTVTTSWATP